MQKKEMESYKPKMFQLQCLKALEQQIEEKIYNEAEIGRMMGVNRSTISRCFKRYREEGFLLEQGRGFTRKGREFLDYYKLIEADLYQYFASIGIGEKEQTQAVGGILDTVDIRTIQKICQKEKMYLHYESIDENREKEICKIPYEKLGHYLKEGSYDVDFAIYRQGKDWQSLSMADNGFQKPARLSYKPGEEYVELTAREMKAMTKGGIVLSGHIQTIKCRSVHDVLQNLDIIDHKIQIPLKEFEFESMSEDEIMAKIPLFMTNSVGEKRMPESMATLIIRC